MILLTIKWQQLKSIEGPTFMMCPTLGVEGGMHEGFTLRSAPSLSLGGSQRATQHRDTIWITSNYF